MTPLSIFVAVLSATVGSTDVHAQRTNGSPPASTKSDPGAPSLPEQSQVPSPPAIGPGASQDPTTSNADIVVSAERPRGSVASDIPPELTFKQLDIRAYGANDIQELLQTLGPQVRSSRGRQDDGPVVLINGKRVSSQAEVDRIPTEAIERMEVFSEELALRYGFRADQKVVNVVLFSRFDSRLAQATYSTPTEGGRAMPGFVANYLRTRGDTRFSFDGDYRRSGALLESERDIRQISGMDELGRFRTLLPETERLTLSGTVSGEVLKDVASSFNGRREASRSESRLGLGIAGPLIGKTRTRVTHMGSVFSGRAGRWSWNLTGNYDRTAIETLVDTNRTDGERNEAASVNRLLDTALVIGGPLLSLPAGTVSASVRGGLDFRDFSSTSVVDGTAQELTLSRDQSSVQANLDIPIARRKASGSHWVGDLSAYANLEIEQLSDFGTLRTFGYGFNWSPSAAINIVGSATNEEGAPTVEQLGAPTVVTPNVRVFDFRRGETVDVTRVFGGNPALKSDDRRALSLGVYLKPFARTDVTFSIDYTNTRIDNPIAAFPITVPAVETAFPERFTRNADGRLARIDSAPLNFARSEQEQIRLGLNFTRPLGSIPEALRNTRVRFARNEAEAQNNLPPGARITRLEPGSPAARQAENLTSRLFVSLYYTLRLEDSISLVKGGPILDLLNGGAVDFRGGRPRHEVELQAGVFKRGLGARLTANWQSGTSISQQGTGSGIDGTSLNFASLGTLDVNLFANLADRFGGSNAPDWLKKTRLTFSVLNVFNERQIVRDARGVTPINYQPANLNPLGRLVSVSLRKMF